MILRLFKKYFVYLYIIFMIFELIGGEFNVPILSKSIKAFLIPSLIFYFYLSRKHHFKIIEEFTIVSLILAFVGLWLEFMIEPGSIFLLISTLVSILEGQTIITILPKCIGDFQSKTTTDLIKFFIIFSIALGYFFVLFSTNTNSIFFIYIIRTLQHAILIYYSSNSKDRYRLLFIAIILSIISEMIWGYGSIFSRTPYQYFTTNLAYYLSKLLFTLSIINILNNPPKSLYKWKMADNPS